MLIAERCLADAELRQLTLNNLQLKLSALSDQRSEFLQLVTTREQH
jgi:hypothetical protein